MPYFDICVIERLGRIWPTRPAACQVVPLVSWPCSSSSTSVRPSLARWYATEQPATPPPTITTCACEGNVMASSQPQRHHARDDRGRACGAAHVEGFLEVHRAEQRGEQHRGFAQRCHGRNRRARHRP